MDRIKGLATLAVCAAAGAAPLAEAGSISIDGIGGDVIMQSKAIAGVFGANSPTFTNDALNAVHGDLHASGITTDGFVTFVLAETDAGLSFMTLVDDNTIGNGAGVFDSQLGMTSTAPDTNVRFINDENQDIQQYFDPGNGTVTAAGHFTWDSTQYGDGFAWADMGEGDFITFNFTKNGPDHPSFPGLNSSDTFQFVSWNGQAWEIVAQGEFSQANQFAFSLTVIPLPAPVLIGAAGLGIVGLVRRRMMASA